MREASLGMSSVIGIWAHSGDTNRRAAQESHWKTWKTKGQSSACTGNQFLPKITLEKSMIFQGALQSGSPFPHFISCYSPSFCSSSQGFQLSGEFSAFMCPRWHLDTPECLCSTSPSLPGFKLIMEKSAYGNNSINKFKNASSPSKHQESVDLKAWLLPFKFWILSIFSRLWVCRKRNAEIEKHIASGHLWEDCKEGLELRMGSYCEAAAPSYGAKETKQFKQGSDKYLQGWAPLQPKWQSSELLSPIPAA